MTARIALRLDSERFADLFRRLARKLSYGRQRRAIRIDAPRAWSRVGPFGTDVEVACAGVSARGRPR